MEHGNDESLLGSGESTFTLESIGQTYGEEIRAQVAALLLERGEGGSVASGEDIEEAYRRVYRGEIDPKFWPGEQPFNSD